MESSIETDLREAARCIVDGGIILYPTDTVWGLGCDARNPDAVGRLFELKRRPDSKAMLLLCADMEMVAAHTGLIPESIKTLLASTDRPTTVIYDDARGIASKLIAPDGSIGIRIPANDFCRQLCRLVGGPVVSTSANFAGQPGAATYADIDPEIMRLTDYVCLNGRTAKPGTPSDIVKVMPDGSVLKLR